MVDCCIIVFFSGFVGLIDVEVGDWIIIIIVVIMLDDCSLLYVNFCVFEFVVGLL